MGKPIQHMYRDEQKVKCNFYFFGQMLALYHHADYMNTENDQYTDFTR